MLMNLLFHEASGERFHDFERRATSRFGYSFLCAFPNALVADSIKVFMADTSNSKTAKVCIFTFYPASISHLDQLIPISRHELCLKIDVAGFILVPRLNFGSLCQKQKFSHSIQISLWHYLLSPPRRVGWSRLANP